MVSRTPQNAEAVAATRQENGVYLQAKEGNGSGTPRLSKKEASTPKPAQDPELKDYVRPSPYISNLIGL